MNINWLCFYIIHVFYRYKSKLGNTLSKIIIMLIETTFDYGKISKSSKKYKNIKNQENQN